MTDFFTLVGNLPGLCANLMDHLHEDCLSIWRPGPSQQISQALICGEDLSSPSLRELWIAAGLYHLLVVSGTHLLFLQELFQRLGRPWSWPWLSRALLFLFCLSCKFQPPVARAFVSSLVHNKWRDPLWSGLFSYLLCLFFRPEWIFSLSLHLATVSALIFSHIQSSKKDGDLGQLRFLLWTLLLPLVSGLGPQSFFVFVLALLLQPLILGLSAAEALTNLGGLRQGEQFCHQWLQASLQMISGFNNWEERGPSLLTSPNYWKYTLAIFSAFLFWQISKRQRAQQ